jgi:hypothetical protein
MFVDRSTNPAEHRFPYTIAFLPGVALIGRCGISVQSQNQVRWVGIFSDLPVTETSTALKISKKHPASVSNHLEDKK